MKLLSGSELAGFMKERQAKQVRGLVQAHKIQPKLAIIQLKDDPVINIYVNLKKMYGNDIGIEVESHAVEQSEALSLIDKLNEDESVHGIIVQLPIADPSEQQEILNRVAKEKDVDGLAENSPFDPATPQAIMWLLAGYNVELNGKKISIVGRGPLVGGPLEKIMLSSELKVQTFGREVKDLEAELSDSDIVITATGQPGLIKSSMVKNGAVVIDAGVAVEDGTAVGDLEKSVLEREDLKITPAKGGVGPLTVVALFENVLKAATKLI